MRNVIAMYDDRNTSSEVIKFLRLQMTLHYPNGAIAEKDGGSFGQSAEWKEHLLRLYTNLVDTTIQNQSEISTYRKNYQYCCRKGFRIMLQRRIKEMLYKTLSS